MVVTCLDTGVVRAPCRIGHKGETRGNRPRTAVILEFHGHGKVRQLLGSNNPCPSSLHFNGADGGATYSRAQELGLPGYALYPQERCAQSAAPRTRGRGAHKR